ncbi:hypothetical protein [uncultured Nevskia sp.]|uniref:hypothetical protein n=1 Tax=uncultured Nevskia sp. TaxID=228950 RepID=UPI0025F5DA67|nr:hypothetical protein [uncultured Nevskia sp.]
MKSRNLPAGSISLLVTAFVLIPSGRVTASSDCDAGLAASIPARSASASVGSEFVRRISGLDDDAREAAILAEVSAGNVPDYMRQLVAVSLTGRMRSGRDVEVTVCVVPDYLAVGSDEDSMLVPMRLSTALTAARRLGFMLPTRKIVNAVYQQAQVHLQPQPLPASDQMRSTAYYWHHTEMVHQQRLATGVPLGALTAGDKKDLVITNRLWRYPDRVAIYGWHRSSGSPIQPLSTVHGSRYADYSHGVRLVAAQVRFEGQWQALSDLLEDGALAELVSDEGAMPRLPQLLALLDVDTARPATAQVANRRSLGNLVTVSK